MHEAGIHYTYICEVGQGVAGTPFPRERVPEAFNPLPRSVDVQKHATVV